MTIEQYLRTMLDAEIQNRREDNPREYPSDRARRAARAVIEEVKNILQPLMFKAMQEGK
jgi:hypothetical protein